MAQDATGNGPAGPQPAPPAAAPAQQLIINAQYVKDLSFENPNAPNSLRQQTAPPAVEINVNVKYGEVPGMGQHNYEVVLTINAGAKIQDDTLFLVELSYGGLVTVRNVPQELLASVLLVETPRLLFPFARNIIAETTRDGGFPPLLINPIDFADVVRRNSAGGQTAAQPPGA
jgi:preprotein translocase subunit SecB